MTEATGTERKRYLQELSIFHDVAKALTSSLDLDSILQTIMEKMAEYFRPDTWSLLMVDEERDELYFAIAVGDAAQSLKDMRLKVGEGIAGWVARHGEGLVVPEASIAACATGEYASNVPGSETMVGNRIVCTGTWESHIVPKEASNEPQRRRREYDGMAVGLTHSRGVGGAMPAESPDSLEGVSRRTQRDE